MGEAHNVRCAILIFGFEGGGNKARYAIFNVPNYGEWENFI